MVSDLTLRKQKKFGTEVEMAGSWTYKTNCYVLRFFVSSVFARPGGFHHPSSYKVVLRRPFLYAWSGQDVEFQ